MMSDTAFAGVARQAELIRTGQVSSRELVQESLDRIAAHDPVLNCFRLVFAERALIEADQADARRKGGDERPLLGVPIAIKDDQDIKGEVTAKGSIAHGGPAAEDSEIVARLRQDGAVLVGKTHVPELMTMNFTETHWYGTTRNPWDLDRTPGGSSGGSAAAVAAGLVAGATASDGAGSIRIPAAATGLIGLKPSPGVVPTPLSWNGLSTFGFLTRTVADSELLYGIAAEEPSTARIALTTKPPLPTLPRPDATTTAALTTAAEVLGRLGHTVTEADPDWGLAGPHIVARFLRGIADDAAAMARPERLDTRSRGLARLGRLSGPVFQRAMAAREADRARLEPDDVWLMPVWTSLPQEIGAFEGLGAVRSLDKAFKLVPFPGVFNHTGLPAISVPIEPMAGAQLVGRMGSEARLLGLAAQLERELGWAGRFPQAFA